MNNDLISRSELRKKLQARYDNGEEDFDKGYNIGVASAIELLDSAPTVTPDKIQAIMNDYLIYRCEPERPQGKWIFRTDTEWHFECNQCKGLSPWKAQFCGVCGADMRGGAE